MQAKSIAKTVMRDAGCGKTGDDKINFSQFMQILEGDNSIDFDAYLRFVHHTQGANQLNLSKTDEEQV